MFTPQFAQFFSTRRLLPWLLIISLLSPAMAQAITYQVSDTPTLCGGLAHDLWSRPGGRCNDDFSVTESSSISTEGKAGSIMLLWNIPTAPRHPHYLSKHVATYSVQNGKGAAAISAAHWEHACSEGFSGTCTDRHDRENEVDLTPMPLPSSLLLFGSALFLFGSLRWRGKERGR